MDSNRKDIFLAVVITTLALAVLFLVALVAWPNLVPGNKTEQVVEPTVQVQATATAIPTAIVPAASVAETQASVVADPAVDSVNVALAANAEVVTSNGWEISKIDLKNDPVVEAWLTKVKAPSPELWPTFPNVANPKVPDFQVANGVEYGMADSPFCEYKQTCDWVIPAWHYRLISGDYKFTSPSFSYSCQNVEGQTRKGCLIVLFNVMNETYTWRDQNLDNGFTVMGRYWNGDKLEWAVWGLTSHAAANMLNYPTMRNSVTGDVLNAGSSINAGANCGIQPDACGTVDVMVVVHAGDRILATMHTTVSR